MSIYRPQTLRYAKLDSVKEERALMNNYYVDIIRQYGNDVTYYRRDTNYDASAVDSATIYGHNPSATFTKHTDIRALLQINEYSFLLNGEGFVPSDKVIIYFGINDFAVSFVNDIGRFKSYKIEETEGIALARNGKITIPFTSEVYSGVCEINVSSGKVEKNVECEIKSASVPCYSVALNPYLYRSFSTDYRNGFFSANIYVDYDFTSSKIKYKLHGDVLYSNFFENEKLLTEIHPNVGDVVEFDYHTADGCKEQYEITEVISRKPTEASNDGLSPFLGKYVYKCAAVRRIASTENLKPEESSNIARDNFMDYAQKRADAISKDNFDWSTSDDDNVYGGYNNADAFTKDRGHMDDGLSDIKQIFDYEQYRGEWDDVAYVEGKYRICTFSDGMVLYTDGSNLYWADGLDDKSPIKLTDLPTVTYEKLPSMMYIRVINGQVMFTPADLSTNVPLTNFTQSILGTFDYMDGFTYKDVGYVNNDGYYIFKNARIALNSFSKTVLRAFADGGDEPIDLARR